MLSQMDVKELLTIASTTVFVLSMTLNSAFIYIVYTKTRTDIGVYKYMMTCFAICNIVYSSTEFVSKPVRYLLCSLL